MKIDLTPEHPVTDDACREATGHDMAHWFAWIESKGLAAKRRDAIRALYDLPEFKKDLWWPTTLWVEFERSRGIVKKDGLGDGYHICSTKNIKATAERVYAAFTQSADLEDWLCGGYTGEVTEGGAFRVCSGANGVYLRLRENKDIRFSWQTAPDLPANQVDVTFKETAGKTLVTLNHARIQDRPEADGLRRAWGDCLSALKAKLEA